MTLLQPVPDLLGRVAAALPLLARNDRTGGRHTRETGEPQPLPQPHVGDHTHVVGLDEAVELTRTGDVWLFRGRSGADRVIRTFTNAPVNHVGMAVVLDDLPPLMWHAELGQSLPDVWAGRHNRGVQLHDLRDAVLTWCQRYGQQAWLRQLSGPVDAEVEDAVLRTIARLAGTPFPSTAQLAGGWLRARLPGAQQTTSVETAFCADVLARTYQAMGVLGTDRPSAFFDPGSFWSGDDLRLEPGWSLGPEISVQQPQTA
ncbi:MAG: uncharacterized protein JWO27_1692 [Frankiales bacterium]|nr:uncharacterized protein [Frankiales bacterium]